MRSWCSLQLLNAALASQLNKLCMLHKMPALEQATQLLAVVALARLCANCKLAEISGSSRNFLERLIRFAYPCSHSSQYHSHGDLARTCRGSSTRMDGFRIPAFQVSQDADHVYISIACPEAAQSAAATPKIAVEANIFGFHLDPYYLPLVLPGMVTRADDEASTIQGSSREQFRVTLTKVETGQHFDGLDDMQPQLLPEDQLKQAMSDAEQAKGFFQPSPSSLAGAGTSSSAGTDEEARTLLQQALRSQGLTTVNDDDGEAAINGGRLQTGTASTDSQKPSSRSESYGYGLRNAFTGPLIPAGCADTRNVLEVSDPDTTAPSQRERAAMAFEEERWDEGVYMENYLDIDGELAHALGYRPTIVASKTAAAKEDETSIDTEALSLLVQLLFALSYDERTNEGDPTVESGWTIAKLSRSLSASTLPHSQASSLEAAVATTLVGCMRRALTVPLYRHWQLAVACVDDTLQHLQGGSSHVRRCLDQIGSRLQDGADPILSRLAEVWIAPMIAQPPSQAQVEQLSRCIRNVMERGDVITKDAVGGEAWDVEVLEQAAKQAFEDGEGGFV